MGQRHQIFLKIHNPVKSTGNRLKGKELTKAKHMFGNSTYTVIALHHQWLYGQSAVVNVKNMLDITRDSDNVYHNPFAKNFVMYSIDEFIEKLMMMVQVQPNPLHPRGIGIERMHFLNTECIDTDGKYKGEWDMRKDCTLGDNNDGITIIDTISRKYCMMNIFTYDVSDELDEDYTGIYNLPSMSPCSAMEYVEAYYPNEEDNKVVCNLLSETEVLSLAEVSKLFKKSFKEIVAE